MPISSIPLQKASKMADRIVELLAPMCDRIDVAGSIRRLRQTVNDIDLVVLPSPGRRRDIRARCLASRPLVITDGDEILSFQLHNGLQIDVFFATHECKELYSTNPCTWGTRLLCRTGSKQFNIWLATKAQDAGMHWNPQHGLYSGTQCVAAAEEADIFTALKLDYINPEDRER